MLVYSLANGVPLEIIVSNDNGVSTLLNGQFRKSMTVLALPLSKNFNMAGQRIGFLVTDFCSTGVNAFRFCGGRGGCPFVINKLDSKLSWNLLSLPINGFVLTRTVQKRKNSHVHRLFLSINSVFVELW